MSTMMDLHLRCAQGYIELENAMFIELTELVTLKDLHIDGDGQNISVTIYLQPIADHENIQKGGVE